MNRIYNLLVATLLVYSTNAELALAAEPTFSHDVAKIIYKKCTICHRPDSSGPFSLIYVQRCSAACSDDRGRVGRQFHAALETGRSWDCLCQCPQLVRSRRAYDQEVDRRRLPRRGPQQDARSTEIRGWMDSRQARHDRENEGQVSSPCGRSRYLSVVRVTAQLVGRQMGEGS